MSYQRILRYQVMLMENPGLTISPCEVLNPATLLPTPKGSLPFHFSLETLDHWTKPQEVLSENPLTNSKEIWYTDGSSFVLDGKRRARYAVVSDFEIIEAKPLLSGTSAQLAELIVLTQALELGKEQRVAIYTDSKYAFLVLHVHAAVWKERATWPPEGPQSNMIKSLGSWRQSICPLRFQSPTVKDNKKGTEKCQERTKQLIRQLGEQHYRTMT